LSAILNHQPTRRVIDSGRSATKIAQRHN
jgi:hypothetical protein